MWNSPACSTDRLPVVVFHLVMHTNRYTGAVWPGLLDEHLPLIHAEPWAQQLPLQQVVPAGQLALVPFSPQHVAPAGMQPAPHATVPSVQTGTHVPLPPHAKPAPQQPPFVPQQDSPAVLLQYPLPVGPMPAPVPVPVPQHTWPGGMQALPHCTAPFVHCSGGGGLGGAGDGGGSTLTHMPEPPGMLTTHAKPGLQQKGWQHVWVVRHWPPVLLLQHW